MSDKAVDFSEILISPAASMIQKLGESVAEAQRLMDQASLQTQADLQKNFPALSEIGYQVTWYQMPEVTMEIKVVVHYEESKEEDGTVKKGIFLSPHNAKYKNAFSFEAEGSSTIKMRIVPVPPPVVQHPGT